MLEVVDEPRPGHEGLNCALPAHIDSSPSHLVRCENLMSTVFETGVGGGGVTERFSPQLNSLTLIHFDISELLYLISELL